MVSFRSLRAVAFLLIAAFFAAPSFGETTAFRVDESQIRFRLSPHPVVEVPVVNTSGKALPGSFKLELLNTNDSVESVVTGTFPGSPGTSVEKIAWPSQACLSPSWPSTRRTSHCKMPSPLEWTKCSGTSTPCANRSRTGKNPSSAMR
jgi:hypothetical protein